MGPKISDRPVTTCRGCRRRKVRCDRQRPICSQCRAANIECVYEKQGHRSYQFIHETPGGSSGQDASAPEDGEVETASPIAIPEHRITALESRVKSLSDMLSTLQQSSSGGTSPLPSVTPQDDQAARSSTAGYLSRQGGGKVRYVNISSWSAMCRDAAEIDDILFSQSQDAYDHADVSVGDDDDQLFLEPISSTLAEEPPTASGPTSAALGSSAVPASFWTQLPSKSICDSVLQRYFDGYHPLVPLVHVPSFWAEYGRFWVTFETQNRARSNLISFATLLLSFLYAGAIVGGDYHAPTLSTGRDTDTITNLYRLTGTALRLAKFPHAPTLDTIRAYLILKSIRMREEEPLSCIAFVGLSVRVANMLGLHKDPKHFPQIGPIEAEVRRRIWWQLVHIDVCLAVAAGLPPLIGIQSWDVQPLSELKDELIGTPDGTQYENDVRDGRRPPDVAAHPSDAASSSMVSTGAILAASKYRFTVAQRRFLSRLEAGFGANEASKIRVRLDELGQLLQQAIDRIPYSSMDNLGTPELESGLESELILNKWARLLISTYKDQRFCMMSYPLLNVPDWQEWNGLHDKTMEATMSFLIKCAQLSIDTLYRRFQWSWPGNHQPLHAVVVLLNEVLSFPESAFADKIGHAIDVVFALVTDREGLVGNATHDTESRTRVLARGGSEVWKYLRRLRARAWRKKGWDPAVTLSREDATRLCRNWFVDEALNIQPMLAPQHSTAAGGPSFTSNQQAFQTPLMGLFGDDISYPGDMDLPDITADMDFLGEMQDFSLDNV